LHTYCCCWNSSATTFNEDLIAGAFWTRILADSQASQKSFPAATWLRQHVCTQQQKTVKANGRIVDLKAVMYSAVVELGRRTRKYYLQQSNQTKLLPNARNFCLHNLRLVSEVNLLGQTHGRTRDIFQSDNYRAQNMFSFFKFSLLNSDS
jgi:hypothetical protein